MLTTKLDAVNTILSCIDESPVSRLNSGLVEADRALTMLEHTNKQVQSQGWFFNLEPQFTLLQNDEGWVELPINCLSIDLAYLQRNGLVQRGNYIYDVIHHTFKLNQNIIIDLILLLDFEEIPEVAKEYITIKAGRILQDRLLTDEQLHNYQQVDEYTALNDLYAAERQAYKFNYFNNQDGFELLNRSTDSKPSWL